MSDKKQVSFKIMLVGECFVGKTNIVQTFLGNPFNEEYASTSGADYNSKEVSISIDEFNKTKTIFLNIWDETGKENYKKLVKLHFSDTQAFILVYDITNKDTFKKLKDFWITEIMNSYKNAKCKYIINFI